MTRLKRISLVVIGVLVVLLLAVLVFSPMAARMVLNDLMEADAIRLSDESTIRLNPFGSSITIDQLELIQEDRSPLKLEKLEVDYRLWRIFFSEAHISRVYLHGLHLQAEMDEENLIVAGFNLAGRGAESGEEAVPEADEDGSASEGTGGLAYAIPEVVFENLRIDLTIHGQSHAVLLDEVAIHRSFYKNQIADSELAARGSVDGAPLTIDAVAHYEATGAQLEVEFDLADLNTDNYQYLLPETIGDLDALTDVNLKLELDRAEDGHLTLEDATAVVKLREFSYVDPQVEVGFQTLQLEADDIDLSLDAANNLHASVSFSTLLDQLDLGLGSGERVQLGRFALQPSAVNLVIKEEADGSHISLEDTTLALELERLDFSNPQAKAGFERLELDATDIGLSLDASERLLTQASFSTTLTGIGAQLSESGDELLALGELALAPASLKLEDGALDFTTPSLTLSDLRGSQVNRENLLQRLEAALASDDSGDRSGLEEGLGIPADLPALLSMETITFDNIALKTNSLSIDTLTLGAGDIQVLLADTGDLVTLADTSALTGGDPVDGADAPEGAEADPAAAEDQSAESGEDAAAEPAEAETAPSGDAAPFVIALGKLTLAEPLAVNFVDESQNPKISKQLSVEKVLVEGVDSGDLQKSTTFELSANDGQYAKIDASGDARPFGELVNANFDLQIREFSLPNVSQYVGKYLDFEFKAGQLDTDFKGSIVDSELDADADLTLRAADFSATQVEAEESNVIGQAAIPLNVALGMLKDSKGNIELRIPVDGSLDDPSFGMEYIMGLVIQKAVMAQTKTYLMSTLVPYAQVVSVAMAAGSLALKVRFEDLSYEPGQVDAGPSQQVFIDQLSQLMKDKPEMQVKVCPVVTPEDLMVLPAVPAEGAAEASAESGAPVNLADVPAAPASDIKRYGPLTEDQKIRINDLATRRATSFKDAVILQGEIESSRLLLCVPEVDYEEGGQTRMKFSV